MPDNFILPSKIFSYLRILELEYQSEDNSVFLKILNTAKVLVKEQQDYDNWNGGTHGHGVVLFVPIETWQKIGLKNKKVYQDKIKEDLSLAADSEVPNEYFCSVSIQLADPVTNQNDNEYQQARFFSEAPQIDPDTLSFWKRNRIRVFISHRDAHKVRVKELANILDAYGFTCFVAHDAIEPMSPWEQEILKGLQTMEIMILFITDDFFHNNWTNQEIGFALARNIPILPLKLGTEDPKGFSSSLQALKASIEMPFDTIALKIIEVLRDKYPDVKGKIITPLIQQFCNSKTYLEAIQFFNQLDGTITKLTQLEEIHIVEGFKTNAQINKCNLVTQKITTFMERTTGNQYEIQDKQLQLIPDYLPF